MANFTPKYRHILTRMEEMRAIEHPIAGALLQLLQDQEITLQQAAVRLGLKAGHLQYYLRRLLDQGLIRLVRKHDSGRNIEKYYRAIAYRYSLPPKRKRNAEMDKMCVLKNAALIQEYASRMDRTPGEWVAEINRVRLAPEDLEEICAEIEKLIIRYRKKRAKDPKALDYKSVWMCFPIAGTGSPVDSPDEADKKVSRSHKSRRQGR